MSKKETTDEKRVLFEHAYADYWEYVKDSVDPDGWVYSKEVPHLLDAYYEANTGNKIQYEKSYQGEWRGPRWRPQSLSHLQ